MIPFLPLLSAISYLKIPFLPLFENNKVWGFPYLNKVIERPFHVFDRYEIHIQAFLYFINGKLIIFNPHLHKNNLQATASAADLSSPRCFDDKMLERFAAAIVALGIRDSNFACL